MSCRLAFESWTPVILEPVSDARIDPRTDTRTDTPTDHALSGARSDGASR